MGLPWRVGETPVETETTFASRFEAFARDGLGSGRWTYWIAETDDGELASHDTSPKSL